MPTLSMRKVFLFLFLLLAAPLVFAQQKDTVDFKNLKAELTFHPENKTVAGNLSYTFEIIAETDSIFLDAKNMEVQLLGNSPTKAKLNTTADKIWISHRFKPGKTYTLNFSYRVENPKHALYFVGWKDEGTNQIWSQGQGKENSHWLPSIDDANDKIIFDISYQVPAEYRVIANGELIDQQSKKSTSVWRYKMNKPMSSYLIGVAVGLYKHKDAQSSSGVPIELYYEAKDSLKVEPTYRYSQRIFDFLEAEIGVAYPWENYKQIPVRDFLYAGMENTTTTIFAESLVTDSIGFTDQNYVRVNAHELAHQWFGNLITENSPADHWLHEGFATYYALLAQREIFGEELFYYKLFEKAEKLKEESDKGKGEALINPEAGYLTFYDKGAWALHILKEQVGATNFKKGVKTFLERYKFQNVKIEDFISVMEAQSKIDLSDFTDNWLKQSAFPAEEALAALEKSEFIKEYMETIALRKTNFEQKKDLLSQALDFPVQRYIGQEAVFQLAEEELTPAHIKLYQKAFDTGNVHVRQAIASSLTSIPPELKSAYESLLKDNSYLTQEHALMNLWSNFQEDNPQYLEELKSTQGFYDKNIRILWLTLSLATPEYLPGKNATFYEELSGYTATTYDYSIRQNAFAHLYQLNVFNREIYMNLMQATTHPVWRFRNFARELLEELLKDRNHENQLRLIQPQLTEKQQKILQKRFTK